MHERAHVALLSAKIIPVLCMLDRDVSLRMVDTLSAICEMRSSEILWLMLDPWDLVLFRNSRVRATEFASCRTCDFLEVAQRLCFCSLLSHE